MPKIVPASSLNRIHSVKIVDAMKRLPKLHSRKRAVLLDMVENIDDSKFISKTIVDNSNDTINHYHHRDILLHRATF